jgi:hypothetical protein
MQPLSKADRSMSHQRPTYGNSPPESAIAPIWLLFYGLALGAPIAPRLVAGVTDPANR